MKPIVKPIFLLLLSLTIFGCTKYYPPEQSHCREPVVVDSICSVAVEKVANDRGVVRVAYVHTGQYGKMLRILVQVYGDGTDRVMGGQVDTYAYPGRHSILIPIGFYEKDKYLDKVYKTESVRVEFRWINEARNSYGGLLMKKEIPLVEEWTQKHGKK